MAKNLVIVESPTKVKTIKKFLGRNYTIVATMGHVRDLPKSQLGIDVEHDFEPKYITIRGKGELLASLRKEVKKADKIYLATDPDREGEAISWHLIPALNLQDKNYARITFNEITKNAVKESFNHQRDIDMNLVDAQQARRVLDRIVGYSISPLLWAKVKRGLSAGRVQSVALRIICDREDEINAFIPKEYYTLDVDLKGTGRKTLTASYHGKGKKAQTIESENELNDILKDIDGKDFTVESIRDTERSVKSPLPFTTSTMQQEASKALNFAISKTMMVAQQLYEGVEIKGMGTVGLITYLRTDSTRVSDEARAAAAAFIGKEYGQEYLGIREDRKTSGKNIQDAHEAIRPANLTILPSEIKDKVTRDQFRLYSLIWKRFMASQMPPQKKKTTSLKLSCAGYDFTAASTSVTFDGFSKVYVDADDKEEKKPKDLSIFEEGEKLSQAKTEPKQHFTQPKPHFTEASLVHTLEELGIGRPSTYAPTISTLLKRHYILKEGRNIFVSELGEIVNHIMVENFPEIVDKAFTANMESLLDGVEAGEVEWKSIIRNFYPDLEKEVKTAEEKLEKVEIKDEETDVICENCGRHMVIKYGPHGKFLACPGFPECRNTKPYLEKIGVKCPKCGKDIVIRKTKKGRKFYGCEDYPTCDFMSWQKPVEKRCPRCGKYMVIRGKRLVCSDPECGYSEEKIEDEG
ncbi:MAG: type I DNA topoisomerase [Lachnospiraceae bacterium]|nr:type I DNA topoisomerase [Lachnospiraceae bacterium]